MRDTLKDDLLSRVRSAFGPAAAAYATSATHGNEVDLARMITLLAPRSAERALDVATGGGHTAFALAPHVAEVVASDITRSMLDEVAARAQREAATHVSIAEADAAHLPFEDGAFDIVTCRIAAHHFEGLAPFVRESSRVLRPGGRLYIFDLSAPEDAAAALFLDELEHLRDESHVECWKTSAWVAAIVAAGLQPSYVTWTPRPAYEMEPWFRRMRCTEEQRTNVLDRLRSAPRAYDEWFALARDPDPAFGAPAIELVAIKGSASSG